MFERYYNSYQKPTFVRKMFCPMENFYTQEQLIRIAKLSNDDLEEIKKCRRDFNQLGFAYQLAFVLDFGQFYN